MHAEFCYKCEIEDKILNSLLTIDLRARDTR